MLQKALTKTLRGCFMYYTNCDPTWAITYNNMRKCVQVCWYLITSEYSNVKSVTLMYNCSSELVHYVQLLLTKQSGARKSTYNGYPDNILI